MLCIQHIQLLLQLLFLVGGHDCDLMEGGAVLSLQIQHVLPQGLKCRVVIRLQSSLLRSERRRQLCLQK